jgi:hypothetical protein
MTTRSGARGHAAESALRGHRLVLLERVGDTATDRKESRFNLTHDPLSPPGNVHLPSSVNCRPFGG